MALPLNQHRNLKELPNNLSRQHFTMIDHGRFPSMPLLSQRTPITFMAPLHSTAPDLGPDVQSHIWTVHSISALGRFPPLRRRNSPVTTQRRLATLLVSHDIVVQRPLRKQKQLFSSRCLIGTIAIAAVRTRALTQSSVQSRCHLPYSRFSIGYPAASQASTAPLM